MILMIFLSFNVYAAAFAAVAAFIPNFRFNILLIHTSHSYKCYTIAFRQTLKECSGVPEHCHHTPKLGQGWCVIYQPRKGSKEQ